MALLATLAAGGLAWAQQSSRPHGLPEEHHNQLNEFVQANPHCVEMTNDCYVCVRSPPEVPKCSTPGIACVATQWRCTKTDK